MCFHKPGGSKADLMRTVRFKGEVEIPIGTSVEGVGIGGLAAYTRVLPWI